MFKFNKAFVGFDLDNNPVYGRRRTEFLASYELERLRLQCKAYMQREFGKPGFVFHGFTPNTTIPVFADPAKSNLVSLHAWQIATYFETPPKERKGPRYYHRRITRAPVATKHRENVRMFREYCTADFDAIEQQVVNSMCAGAAMDVLRQYGISVHRVRTAGPVMRGRIETEWPEYSDYPMFIDSPMLLCYVVVGDKIRSLTIDEIPDRVAGRHPLHDADWRRRAMKRGILDRERSTGRTTILAFKYIAEAMEKPGEAVRLRDHHRSRAADEHLSHVVAGILGLTGLQHLHVNHKEYTLTFERR